jgi:hypothetical protein
MVNMNINDLLQIYREEWEAQNQLFIQNKLDNPFPSPDLIDVNTLTREELRRLKDVPMVDRKQIFYGIYKILGERLLIKQAYETTVSDARSFVGFKSSDSVPKQETVKLRSFYFAHPIFPGRLQLKWGELVWLYKHGYIPHLYWNDGQPLFHRNMWFITDFMIRMAREKTGLGVFNPFSDWLPDFYYLKNSLQLTVFMYYSFKLGVRIMHLADQNAKKANLKGKEFRSTSRAYSDQYWLKYGKPLAGELVSTSSLVRGGMNLIRYYRDIFALLSFEAFPSGYLVDIFSQPKQRGAVMMNFDPFTTIAVHNLGVGDINTYSYEDLSEKYSTLYSSVEWALSMSEGRLAEKLINVVGQYRRREQTNGMVPCRVCGDLFKPIRRTYDVTCGKKGCIAENKRLSKRKDSVFMPPIIG